MKRVGGPGLKNLVIIFCMVIFCSGCSVFMAAKQPDKKNLDLFKVGTPRDMLLAEFGVPVNSEVRDDGQKHEIFSFTQGYSSGVKTGRALFHGAADILTVGLWEVVGTPTESIFDGDKMVYSVRYDDKGLVDKITVLKGEESPPNSGQSSEQTSGPDSGHTSDQDSGKQVFH